MREILFRGKRNGFGEWVQGNLTQYMDLCGETHYYITPQDDSIATYEVDPETVGQFTGMLDKNDKRIFEGDIVDILTENEETGIVTYEDGGFWVNADGFNVDFHSNINGTDLEIIGNIHDNPELLKEEE